MIAIVGVLLFAVLIGLSIALHEVGHLTPAKKFGVKVTEYMVGFGPVVWARQKGETRYGFKAIPLGGYIRMIGMLPPGRVSAERPAGRFAGMVDDARRQSAAEVLPGQESRAFYSLSAPRKIVVMLGGPTMNLILAFLLFTVVLVGIGLPQPSLRVGELSPCVPTLAQPEAAPLPSGECPTGSAVSPAVAAGLRAGDVMVAINGVRMTEWDQALDWIRAHPNSQATIQVERDGALVDLPIAVAAATRPVYDQDGQATSETISGGFIGVAPSFDYVAQPLSAVPAFMWNITTRSVMGLVTMPVRLYELVTQTLIGGGERSLNSPVSVVGASRLGGDIAALDEPMSAKVATFLGLIASLNLFLFLFNLLPILPLDGGHVVGAVYEGIRRRVARMRGRPDPGPVDLARLLPVAYVVAGVLVAAGVIVIWADVVKPISLG